MLDVLNRLLEGIANGIIVGWAIGWAIGKLMFRADAPPRWKSPGPFKCRRAQLGPVPTGYGRCRVLAAQCGELGDCPCEWRP